MISKKLVSLLYLTAVIGLFLYSFTQIDLNLTLSKASFIKDIESQFQYIGFFQRPLSTVIFSAILIFLSASYFFLLNLAKKGILKIKDILIISFITTAILVFSYNAFSYDLFNYIFYGKIVAFYHQNPYLLAPTHFVNDPMLNFMRWTHVLYPYGPAWLLLSVPLSVLGFGFFIPTFFLYKALIGLAYFLSTYLIYKISLKIFPKQAILNASFFAFNPLVIIECLVSSHNDIVMFFIFLLAFYLFLKGKRVLSWGSLLFSVAVKFATGIFIPIFLYLEFLNFKNKKIDWEKVIIYSLALSFIVVLAETARTNFQPWYLIFPLILAAFGSTRSYIFYPSIVASFCAVSVYIPYVYLTDYANNYPQMLGIFESFGVLVFLLSIALVFVKNKFLPRH